MSMEKVKQVRMIKGKDSARCIDMVIGLDMCQSIWRRGPNSDRQCAQYIGCKSYHGQSVAQVWYRRMQRRSLLHICWLKH